MNKLNMQVLFIVVNSAYKKLQQKKHVHSYHLSQYQGWDIRTAIFTRTAVSLDVLKRRLKTELLVAAFSNVNRLFFTAPLQS